jgi:hypothetical protein
VVRKQRECAPNPAGALPGIERRSKAPAIKTLISRRTIRIIFVDHNFRAVGDMPEWGNCALVLAEPVEAEWAQSTNALTQGDRACVLVQHKGGWRRVTPVTPDDLALARCEIRAALVALSQF